MDAPSHAPSMTPVELAARFAAVIPAGSSTTSKAPTLLPQEPAAIVRGDGCRVWDTDGRCFIDYRNGLGPVTLGYRDPSVDAAIRAQLDRGIVFGHPHPLELQAAEQFCALVPGAERARFLKTGGEALAAVIRVARAFTGRDRIVQIGYNGWLNSLAPGARVLPGRAVDHPAGVPAALSALHTQAGWGDQDALRALFDRDGTQIAAVVVSADYARMEQGATFYPFLRELTTAHGALLIFDEIVTGFRIAVGGVQEYFGVRPDLSVFGKGLANGMPLSIYAGRADVLDLIGRGEVVVSSTFGGETLSLAAAVATMTRFRDEDVVGHLWRQGARLWAGVNAQFAGHGLPLAVRGFAPCPSIVATGDGVTVADYLRAAYGHGVSLYSVSYVNLSHDDQAIDETLERLDAAAAELAARIGSA